MTRDALRATPLITAAQGAAYLQIARSTWYAWEAAGTLPTHRVVLPGVTAARWCGETLAQFGTPEDLRRRRAAALKGAA